MPSIACEEFFISDFQQTDRTAAHQHLAHQRSENPLLWRGSPINERFAVYRHLYRCMTT